VAEGACCTGAGGLVAIAGTLTLSLHRRNGPLTGWVYIRVHGHEEPMRLIVAVTGALTVLVLVLPVHP
jgi:hypothetical protein